MEDVAMTDRPAERKFGAAYTPRDGVWVSVLAASFAFGLAASWQRWGNPLIDTGREMNQPLRLAGGEMLYSDVRHIYGPLSPWLHALLFRIFGPSLTVLYADGILIAALILALVYWLGRQVMSPAAAGAATLSVMSLCVFKPAGNYILPYSYNSLHGAALGLTTLAILVAALKNGRTPTLTPFLLAGATAGLTLLTKLEMGMAALAAGVTAGLLAGYRNGRHGVGLAFGFVGSAAAFTVAGYAIVAARAGWSTLVADSWLLLYNVPPELAYFNRWVSGFSNPARSIWRMLLAAIKLGIVAAIIAAISSIIAARQARAEHADRRDPDWNGAAPAGLSRPWRVLAAAAALVIVMSATTGLDWDKGPYLAMPFLLIGVLYMLIRRFLADRGTASAETTILITCAVYALASLARMILHVRSGGAYASYLLPVSVVMFTYLWVGPFAEWVRHGRTARAARTIALTLIVGNALATSGILAYRYQTRNTVAITSARGTIIAAPDVAQAWNEALAYIDRHTRPGDPVAVMPEGTSLNFLSGRKNPLREEITTPGFLDAAGEERAIRQLRDAGTKLVLITNRPTAEFGPAAFGRDYCQRLMRWIEAQYTPCAMFGPVKDESLQIGDVPFFIRAYCPVKQTPSVTLVRTHD
jgi:hypothetical protein